MGWTDWLPPVAIYNAVKDNKTLWGGLGVSPDPNASKFTDRDQIQAQITQGLAGANTRQAPQMQGARVGQVAQGNGASIDQTNYNQWRNQQLGLAQQLQGVASGQQQGAGEMAVQRQIQSGLGAQQAQARMARGGNAGLALRGAATNSANLNVAGAGMGAQAAASDQANARAQLGQVLGQGAGQDIGIGQGNAQLQQQMNLANLDARNQAIFQQAGLDQSTSLSNMQAKLQTMGLNDAAIADYMSKLLGMDTAELQARMGQEQAAMGQKGIGGDLLVAGGRLAASA